MSRSASMIVTAIVAALLVRISVTGEHTRYVKAGMGPWLLVAGLVLAATTALVIVSERVGVEPNHTHAGPPIGWLLLGLVLVLFVVSPGPLASYALDRTTRVDITRGGSSFSPIEPQAEPRAISLLEFSQRAFDGGESSFGQNTLRLTGFVAPNRGGDFALARYRIACCAADAQATIVRIVGAEQPATADAWVSVDGTYEGTSDDYAVLRATHVKVVAAPTDPYE